MLLNVAKDAYFTTALNNTLCTECFKPFCCINHCLKFFSKASRLLFIFIRTGHAQFSNNKIHISSEPDKPTLVFQLYSAKKILLWKPDSMSVESYYAHFLVWKKKTAFKPKLTSAECTQSAFTCALRMHSLVQSALICKFISVTFILRFIST